MSALRHLASPRATLRVLAAVQTAGAVVLAVYPDRATKLVGADRHLAPPTWIVRVLGVRSGLQGAAELAWPTPAAAWTGAAIDAAHAASMAAVALASRRYRRAALLSGALAAGSAIALASTAARETRRS
jgi:hypothetical protein